MHIAWFVGWFCLSFVVGVGACAGLTSNMFAQLGWLIVAALIASTCLLFRYWWLVPVMCTAGCLIGLWRGTGLEIKLEQYKPFYGLVVILSGRVSQDTSFGAQGDQRLNIKNPVINGTPLEGEAWISIAKKDVKRGDIVTVRGKLGEGFGNLSATMYRAETVEVIRPNPGDVARRVRDWFAGGVRRGIPDPQASLGLGYLLGQKTALPKDLEEDIKITGLTHVVVASGYNLTILVIFCRRLFLRISKFTATVASSLMIMSFMLITGLSPSMSRAGLVAGLGLLVWYYGRGMHPFVLLSFAAAVTVAIQPSYVWGDLGWYLSFTAFIGVIVLAPLLHAYFWGADKQPGMLRDLFVGTLAAQIVTTPVILLSFGIVSVYALPANMLVLPLVPLAMLCTFITGIVGLALPGLAMIAGFPATIILRYSTEVISYVASLPNSQTELIFNPPVMIASYIGLAVVVTFLKRRTHYDFRNPDAQIDKY